MEAGVGEREERPGAGDSGGEEGGDGEDEEEGDEDDDGKCEEWARRAGRGAMAARSAPEVRAAPQKSDSKHTRTRARAGGGAPLIPSDTATLTPAICPTSDAMAMT